MQELPKYEHTWSAHEYMQDLLRYEYTMQMRIRSNNKYEYAQENFDKIQKESEQVKYENIWVAHTNSFKYEQTQVLSKYEALGIRSQI